MIHVIMGLKGSGKTKKLIDAIHEAVAEANGFNIGISLHIAGEHGHRIGIIKKVGIRA